MLVLFDLKNVLCMLMINIVNDFSIFKSKLRCVIHLNLRYLMMFNTSYTHLIPYNV